MPDDTDSSMEKISMPHKHVSIDPSKISPLERHKMSIGSVVPRPIAWASTVDADGNPNLAPFSYFMGCHSYVPALAISVGSREGEPKDTRANILATGEFVVNMVDFDLVEKMNQTAAAFPAGVNEFEVAGLSALPSVKVAPPRVAEFAAPDRMQAIASCTSGRGPKGQFRIHRPGPDVACAGGSHRR